MLLRHEGFRRLCRARDRLSEVPEHPLSIEDVAREAQISLFHFIRQFEAVFGATEKALRFYTEVLGFKKQHDIPVGEYRWITVTSPEGPDDLELALEPNANPAGKTFQDAMFSQGIPLAAFEVTDIAGEFTRLAGKGVAFTRRPAQAGPVTIAVIADTCGNLIQLYQPT